MVEYLDHYIENSFSELSKIRNDFVYSFKAIEIGYVKSITTGIAKVIGLPQVGYEELLEFQDNVYGIAFNIDQDEIGVVLLGDERQLNVGDEVYRTGRVMDIPVSELLIGRVINPLGQLLDDKGLIQFVKSLPIERPSPSIMDRAAVDVPMQTGLKVIDALIPIGRGQRELILGDRKTGKTSIAIDTIINQAGKNVVCIYCAIGQRASSVAKVISRLSEKGAMDYTIVVVTEGNNPSGLQYIAPYAATSLGEYFMEQGRDVLVVYDDLTQHARAYRELSLLLRRSPGREAFPGDIFYIHSRLLERSTHLSKEFGGGSLTALPIVETEAQNISGYIPTNLISITDGQIYLSPKLFELGNLPAVDVGKSVSRVGGKAQLHAYQSVAGSLKLAYAQFEELETFVRFGSHVDERTSKIIEHGKRIRACFKQQENNPIPVTEQIIILISLTNGLLDNIPLYRIKDAENTLSESVTEIPEDIINKILLSENISRSDIDGILKIAKEKLITFQMQDVKKELE